METEKYSEENSTLNCIAQCLSRLNVQTPEEHEETEKLQSKANFDLINMKSLNFKGCKDAVDKLSKNYSKLTALELEELHVSSCEISDIPDEIFRLKYLKRLDLSDNLLGKIDEEISNLTNLLHLDLSSNKLCNLPSGLKHLTRLRYLNISKNSFSEIPAVLHQGLRLLLKLDMSNNMFYQFESPPLCITTLIELNLSSNDLVQVPPWIFSNESCLETVDISNNPIYEHVEIPLANVCSKGSFETLKVLNLQNCNVTYEKLDFILFLKNLKTLHLGNLENGESKNLIEGIQPTILKNASLENLSLSFGNLAVLPTDFGILTTIKVLDLSNNFLSWLPDSFSELINLEVCNLSSNTISFLPQMIGNLTNLKKLYLYDNQLYDLPESFNQLKNLELVDLYNNKIEQISCDIFKNMNLKGIDLEQNLLNFEELSMDFEHFQVKYENLKENLRKIVDVDKRRLDVQKESNTDDCTERDEMDSFRSEYSDDDNGELVYEDNVGDIDDWDKSEEEPEIENVVVVEDTFDPNETTDTIYQVAYKQQKEKELFKGNYCPADNHIPSVLPILLKNKKAPVFSDGSIVEGQFDSD